MSDLCVFSTGNDLSLLRKSCERVGIDLHEYQASGGYVSCKLRAGLEFLKGRTETYAMWVDGHDSLVLQPERTILKRWNNPFVLIAAEVNCWPDVAMAGKYGPPYLNAGGYIGPRNTMIATMELVLKYAKDEDDQRAWTAAVVAGLPVCFDGSRRVFSCVGDGEEALKADTCVMHFNGRVPGREEFFNALPKLG